MTPEQAQALRAPFPEEVIGKLPRITCSQCRDSRNKVCEKHNKSECQTCHNWITNAHMHLDYCGHAAVTDRLLQVDPEWYWEPVAIHPDTGAPVLTDGGLWIKLCVCDVWRYGFGDAEGKTGGSAMKERIGDAIRNAAMRFGVALDLWAKEDLHAAAPIATADPAVIDDLRKRMTAEHMTPKDRADFKTTFGPLDDLPASQAPAAEAFVVEREQAIARVVPASPEADDSTPEASSKPKGVPEVPDPPKEAPDPTIDWKAFGKELGLKQLDVLNAARDVAEAHNMAKPGSLQHVPEELNAELTRALTDIAAQRA